MYNFQLIGKMIKTISAPQKRILILFAGTVLILLAVWSLVFLSVKGALARIKKDLVDVNSQIKQIETDVDPGKDIDEVNSALEKRFRQLESKFSKKEEGALRLLSDFARKFNIGIVYIRSQPKVFFLDSNKQKVTLEDMSCYQFLISLEIKSTYKDLLKYIETIKESLPAFVVIERIRISKDPYGTPVSNINIDLNLYLLL